MKLKRWLLGIALASLVSGLALVLIMRPRMAAIEAAQAVYDSAVGGGDLPAQAKALETLASLQSWKKGLWEQAGSLNLQGGEPAAAIQDFEKASTTGQLSIKGMILLGDAYLLQDQAGQAVEQWREAVKAGNLEGYGRLSDYYRSEKNWADFTANLQAWVHADPGDGKPLMLLALIETASGSEIGAGDLRIAIERNPDFAESLRKIENADITGSLSAYAGYQPVVVGRALGDAGNWDFAQIAFERSVAMAPDYAEAWAFLSEAKYQQGLGGLEEIQQALKLNPDSVLSQALYAMRLRREGKPAEALPYIQAVSTLEPDQPIWHTEIGATLAEMGKINEALAEFQSAVNLQPQNAQLWEMLAKFCIEHNLDLRTTGLQAARQALALAPSSSEALDLMGWTMFLLEDTTSAERFLHRALEKDAENTSAYLHLGQVYLQLKQNDLAFQNLKNAARLAKNNSETQLLANRLLERYFGTTETRP